MSPTLCYDRSALLAYRPTSTDITTTEEKDHKKHNMNCNNVKHPLESLRLAARPHEPEITNQKSRQPEVWQKITGMTKRQQRRWRRKCQLKAAKTKEAENSIFKSTKKMFATTNS